MTDIESSTEHLRCLEGDYGDVLGLHHRILREVVAEEKGREIGSEGDSLAAIFRDASTALRAAVRAQRRLIQTDWPDSPWRDRMVVHSGDVVLGDSDAVGMALHQAARVRSVAHGGQIIVTESARHSIGEMLDSDVSLIDLGAHVVRDFTQVVRIYQVRAAGLPSEFPALRTMASKAVPVARTSFVGRTKELDEIAGCLERSQIVTIVGPGGCGKTRLAYEAARLTDYDWIVVVELAGLRDEAQVLAEASAALGSRSGDEIASAIGTRQVLLLLDNCEHLIEAAGSLVRRLSSGCPNMVTLATSREPLNVAGELVWLTPPLGITDAVALFSARATGPVDNKLAISACHRLDRMPLAIELAAARTRSMGLSDLVDRLDDQLSLLTIGKRDTPRHKTLRTTLEWSHDLLTSEERRVFRRLAVFAGGFTLDAAEIVARQGHEDVVRGLDGLVTKSLVQLSPGGSRYSLLEAVRQFALEQLAVAGEEVATEEAHVRWATGLARQGNRMLFVEQRKWNQILDVERENFGAAIGWTLSTGRLAATCAIVSNLAWYWFTSARNDALIWVTPLLDQIDQLSLTDRAKALLAGGITHCDYHEDERPLTWLREAESIFRELDNRRSLGATLFWLGRAEAGRSQFDSAATRFDEALSIHEELGDTFGLGWSLTWIGVLARIRGDLDSDEETQEKVLDVCHGVPHVSAQAWGELSFVSAERGDFTGAARRIARATELYRELDDRWQLGLALGNQASYLLFDDPEGAARLLIESLTVLRDIGANPDIHFVLEAAASALLLGGQPARAATIAGAVREHLVLSEGSPWEGSMRPLRNRLRSLLSGTEYSRELKVGQRLGDRGAADTAISWLSELGPEET